MRDPRRNPMSADPKMQLSKARQALASKGPSEAAFQAQVKDLAALYRWDVYHTHRSQFSEAGFPDLICVRDDVMLALELKTETGKVTPEQELWLAKLAAVPGVTARLLRPSQYDELLELFR